MTRPHDAQEFLHEEPRIAAFFPRTSQHFGVRLTVASEGDYKSMPGF